MKLPDYGIGKPAYKESSGPPPLLTAIGGLVVGAVAAGLIAFGLGGGSDAPVPAPVVSASASAKEEPSAAPSAEPPPLSLVARVSLGEEDAVKELEARSREERTAEETIALARAQNAGRRKEIAELKHKIELVPKVAASPDTVKAVIDFAKDPAVAIDILEMLSTLEGDAAPDVLYKLSRSWSIRSKDTKRLAVDLLYSKDVRKKASPALALVLDLKAVEDCDEAAKLLEKVKEIGDKRAQSAMGRFYSKRGCGPRKLLDCWPCLRGRGNDLLKDAVVAAKKRQPPL